MRMFRALPAYFGGKRRLLGSIFRSLPLPGEAPVFIDPFLGGASVSLYAKARGHRVLCNDIAPRSNIVGKALIENSTVRLDYDDLVRLAVPTEEFGYAESELAPEIFPAAHARYLDLVLANAHSLGHAKQSLARLMVIKHALRLRPMGNFGARTIMRQVAAEAWEEMNINYLRACYEITD